jgi:regulator of protease activity HflC (stomatin/prohibitin superfamily)
MQIIVNLNIKIGILSSNKTKTFLTMTPFVLIMMAIVAVIAAASLKTVQQGTVAVTTIFGKYSGILRPGLNFVLPFVQQVFKRISVQNRSTELEFQATTKDQANVFFKTLIVYAALGDSEENIKKVAFKFIDERNFMQALIRTVEGSIRAFVATKRQSEVLSLRNEIVHDVKQQLDQTLEDWGFHLLDLQLNEITFDATIMESMSRVVASNNLKAAAENEGQALLITKTKGAEAEGNAIKIAAEAERQAAQLRGQGIALFREEVAKGMAQAAKEMNAADLDATFLLYSMWTEAIKHFAENGKGNTIFLDGSNDAMQRNMQQLMSMQQKKS